MSTLLRILAVLAAIAFTLTTTGVILLRPPATLGLRAQVYKDVLAKERLYEQMPQLVGETLRVAAESRDRWATDAVGVDGNAQDAFAAVVRALEPEDWELLIGGAIPTDLMRAEVEKGLDAAERFIRGDDAAGSASISLSEVKQRLGGAAMTEAYAALLARKPPCTPAQWEASMGMPVACRPSADQMATALDTFGRVSQSMAAELPDTIPLFDGLEDFAGPEGDMLRIEQARLAVRRIDLVAHWSPAVPVALAFLVLVLAVRSFRGLLLWWGIPCLVASAIGSILALGLISVGAGMVQGIASADLPADAPVALVSAILGLGSTLVRALLAPALGTSLVLAAAGFGAVVVAFVIRPKASPPPLVAR